MVRYSTGRMLLCLNESFIYILRDELRVQYNPNSTPSGLIEVIVGRALFVVTLLLSKPCE